MTSVPVGNALRQFAETQSLRPDLARASRATAAFMLPMVLHAFGLLPVDAVFASIVAQNIAMLDVRGDYRLRVSLLLAMTLLLAAAGALGSLVAGHVYAVTIGSMLVALGVALWRHVGNDYGPALAASSMLLFLIATAHAGGSGDTLRTIHAILFGGAIGLAIQTLLWPFRAQHPLRRSVSDSWSAAADYYEALQPDAKPGAITDAEAALRAALDQASQTLAGAARRRRSRETLPDRLEALNLRAARLAVRVGSVHTALDGIRGTPAHRHLAPSLPPLLANLVNTARGVAVTVVSRQPAHLASVEVRLRRLDSLLEALQGRLAGLAEQTTASLGPLLQRVRETVPEIAESLRATLDRSGERAQFALELTDLQTWQLRPLASALNFNRRFDPALARFGLRMAVFVGIASILAHWLRIPHGYWLPFTLVVVMQPDYGSTRAKALQRVGGTVAGSAAASLLLWLNPPHALHLALIGLGVFGFAYFLKCRYGVAVFFVTIFVVLLLEQAGQSTAAVEIERIGATLCGGLLALFAAQLFWPVRERDRFPALFAGALRANRDYLARLHARLVAGLGLDDETTGAKRAAESAGAALFASLGRLFSDTRAPRAEVERIAALANGNQRVLRLANILLVSLREGSIARGAEIDSYFRALLKTLDHLADHSADPATVRPFELAARAADLDTLPVPPEIVSPHENLVIEHLLRAVTEVRAMLAAAAPASR